MVIISFQNPSSSEIWAQISQSVGCIYISFRHQLCTWGLSLLLLLLHRVCSNLLCCRDVYLEMWHPTEQQQLSGFRNKLDLICFAERNSWRIKTCVWWFVRVHDLRRPFIIGQFFLNAFLLLVPYSSSCLNCPKTIHLSLTMSRRNSDNGHVVDGLRVFYQCF